MWAQQFCQPAYVPPQWMPGQWPAPAFAPNCIPPPMPAQCQPAAHDPPRPQSSRHKQRDRQDRPPQDPTRNTEMALHKLAHELERVRIANEKLARRDYDDEHERHRMRRDYQREQADIAERERLLVEKYRHSELQREERERSLAEKVKRQETDQSARERSIVERVRRQEAEQEERERILVEKVKRQEAEQKTRERDLVAQVKKQEAEAAAQQSRLAAEAIERYKTAEAEKARKEKEAEEAFVAKMKEREAKLKADEAKLRTDEAARARDYEEKRQLALIKQKENEAAARVRFETQLREYLCKTGVPERVITRMIKEHNERTLKIETTTHLTTGDGCGGAGGGGGPVAQSSPTSPIVQKRYLAARTLRCFNVPVEPSSNKDSYWVLPPGTSESTIRQMFQYQREVDEWNAKHSRKKSRTWGIFGL